MLSAKVPLPLTTGPFTIATSSEYGVTKSALRGDEWWRVLQGVWAHASVPDNRITRLAAVRLILRGRAFVCGLSAAWLWGIDVQDGRGDLVWVGHPTGYRPRGRQGMLVRELTVDDGDITTLGDVPITTILRTTFDCARWLSLVEAVVVADFFASAGYVSADDLAVYLRSHRGLRGCRQVLDVIRLMNPRSESPMESRLRLLLIAAGLGWLEPQYEIRDALGRFVARVDFAYVAQRVIVEYDGADHWKQRRADDRRREAIRRLGWTVLVISSDDYYKTPDDVVARVRYELATATS